MTGKRHFRDGSYNPMWPTYSDTPAAVLTIGGGSLGTSAVMFDDVRLTRDGGNWTAESDDADRTWRGTADTDTGAVLALLADRIGLCAEVTIKPEPGEEQ